MPSPHFAVCSLNTLLRGPLQIQATSLAKSGLLQSVSNSTITLSIIQNIRKALDSTGTYELLDVINISCNS